LLAGQICLHTCMQSNSHVQKKGITTVEQFNCPLSETISSFGKYGNESHYGNAVMFEMIILLQSGFFVKTKFKLTYEGSLLYQINCNRVEVSLHTFK